MIDLSNVVDVPIEEIKEDDEILIKCKVDDVYTNNSKCKLRVVINTLTEISCGIANDQYVGKIEHPPKVGDRYRDEHRQPIRVLLVVRNYVVVEYEAAELKPLVYTLDDLKRLEKLPPI